MCPQAKAGKLKCYRVDVAIEELLTENITAGKHDILCCI